MIVNVVTDNHITGRERLVGEVKAAVKHALDRFAPQLTRVEVHLADENSHKQGTADKRCTVEARLSGLAPLAASANGDSLNQAVGAALDKLVAQLDHKLGRLSDRKGRKPYGGEEPS